MEMMRITGVVAVAVLLAGQAAVADVVRHKAVPVPLRGTWASSADDCNKSDKSVITLSADRYAGSDAHCAVLWVSETAGARGTVYSARMRCSNKEKGSGEVISNLVLMPKDTDQISAGSTFDSLKTYQRCPAKEPAAQK
jgi:hypothetical protein